MCTYNKENLTRKSAVGHYASVGSKSARVLRSMSFRFSSQPQTALFKSFTRFKMAFYWTDTAVTPQNYCQISCTHKQIKFVNESLSRKTCSSYIRVSKFVKKLVKENSSVRGFKLLYLTIQKGWPNNRDDVSESLRPYWNYRDELSINDGLIYKGHRTVIPSSMQCDILLKVHKNHFGAASNVRMAKQVIFWPGMSKSISDMCNSCEQCAKYQSVAPREPMKSLPIPNLPWQIVSQDLFELEQKSYLVTVCHFSDWIEVDALPDTLSATVINATKAHFARYGIAPICHTDNGPQFIRSTRVLPHHITSNIHDHLLTIPQGIDGGHACKT